MKANRSQVKLQQAQQRIQQGDLAGAKQTLKGLLRKFPRDLNVVFLTGQVFGMLGEHQQAERVFASVSHLHKLPAPLLFNLGLSQAQQGKLGDAIGSYQKALKADSGNIKYLANLCNGLIELCRYDEAQRWLSRWLELAPTSADPQLLQAICYQAEQRWQQAATAYQQALTQGADPYQCHLNLSVVAKQRGDLLAAIESAEQALAAKPDCPVLNYNLGAYHLALGNIEPAVELWRTVAAGSSKQRDNAASALLYASNLSVDYDRQLAFEAHQRWGASRQNSASSASLRDDLLQRLQHSPQPLTVGFMSEGFHQHPIGFFMTGLLEQIDPQRIRPVLIAQLDHPDELSQRLQQHCAQWIDISAMNDVLAAEAISAAELDILVDLDSHTSSRINLIAQRHAPVQVSYLGYANSSGLPSIDYRITDATVDPQPDADRYYTEQLIRLDRPFFCYQPPAIDVSVITTPLAEATPIRFGSFNKAEKINGRVIELWCRVLHAVPGSTLLLQMAILSQPTGQAWMLARFAEHGIASERLQLHGWGTLPTYLERHNEVDLILDSQPWNGHTNTCHALWMGVPTLTIMADHFAGRFGGLIMQAVDCGEFVVEDESAFVAQAQRLSGDVESLRLRNQTLRPQLLSSSLCDAEDFARQMEDTFQRMWSKQQTTQGGQAVARKPALYESNAI